MGKNNAVSALSRGCCCHGCCCPEDCRPAYVHTCGGSHPAASQSAAPLPRQACSSPSPQPPVCSKGVGGTIASKMSEGRAGERFSIHKHVTRGHPQRITAQCSRIRGPRALAQAHTAHTAHSAHSTAQRTSLGTRSPLSMKERARRPAGVPAATSARSRSPTEMWTRPYCSRWRYRWRGSTGCVQWGVWVG